MVLVVGLGNPGKKYDRTRHNAGFHVVDALADTHGSPVFRAKFSAVIARTSVFTTDVTLLKPQTFMNLSGESVQPAQAFLKVALADIIVVHDELDIPFGEVRIKVGGGSAGHNGLKSLTQRLGSPEYVRVRIGIGRAPAGYPGDVADWVLAEPSGVEAAEWPDLIRKGRAAVEAIVRDGAAAAMNALHQKPPKGPAPKRTESTAPKPESPRSKN